MSNRQLTQRRFYTGILAYFVIMAGVLPTAVDAAATAAPSASTACTPCSESANPKLQRFYDIDDQMQTAYKARAFAKARALADEYLQLAPQFNCDWNYGNALHDGNEMLGLLSLQAGDTDSASKYLIEAGKTKGSPQLDSFGPDLELANALLQAGKVEPVKEYLKEIKSFWEVDGGDVDAWITEIDKGGKPHLDRNDVQFHGGTLIQLVRYAAFIWPAIAVLLVLLATRKRLKGKILVFLIGGLVLSYLAFFASTLLVIFGMTAATNLISVAWENLFFIAYFVLTALAWIMPIAAVYLLSRFLRRIERGEATK